MSTARVLAFALFVAAIAAYPAAADDASPSIAVTGQVQHPRTLTIADLERLPATTVAVGFQTDHGAENATYAGALLWTVLTNAGPVDAPGRNTRLRHTVLVTGRDGYAVSLSEGEIDPDFEGKPVILAYQRDGAPAAGIRLVVPGDKHGGRAVRDVVSVELR